jgi:hypothetical protein
MSQNACGMNSGQVLKRLTYFEPEIDRWVCQGYTEKRLTDEVGVMARAVDLSFVVVVEFVSFRPSLQYIVFAVFLM